MPLPILACTVTGALWSGLSVELGAMCNIVLCRLRVLLMVSCDGSAHAPGTGRQAPPRDKTSAVGTCRPQGVPSRDNRGLHFKDGQQLALAVHVILRDVVHDSQL